MAPDTVALFGVLKVKVEWFVNTMTRGVFNRPACGGCCHAIARSPTRPRR